MKCIFNRNPNIFIYFPHTSMKIFSQKKLQYYCFVTKKSYSITSFTIKHHSPIINLFFCNKKE
ncbi:hypothetical protein COM21_12305 [Bacillus toyonensis]|nr:hypothetical protein COM21_12305 [Bacillus toyonensis]PHD68131.1 hypothetical protein COF61_04310 [Bacillus toyonensis]